MALDFAELMDRIVVNEKAALTALTTPVTADAVPYFFHVQESWPYFTNRLGPYTVGDDSEDVDTITIDILMRLVIAHLSSGYKGENDDKLALYAAQVIEYFNEREWLQSATYPAALRYLVRARIRAGTGYTVFVNSGVGGVTQIGTEFTLRCELMHDIEQVYA